MVYNNKHHPDPLPTSNTGSSVTIPRDPNDLPVVVQVKPSSSTSQLKRWSKLLGAKWLDLPENERRRRLAIISPVPLLIAIGLLIYDLWRQYSRPDGTCHGSPTGHGCKILTIVFLIGIVMLTIANCFLFQMEDLRTRSFVQRSRMRWKIGFFCGSLVFSNIPALITPLTSWGFGISCLLMVWGWYCETIIASKTDLCLFPTFAAVSASISFSIALRPGRFVPDCWRIVTVLLGSAVLHILSWMFARSLLGAESPSIDQVARKEEESPAAEVTRSSGGVCPVCNNKGLLDDKDELEGRVLLV